MGPLWGEKELTCPKDIVPGYVLKEYLLWKCWQAVPQYPPQSSAYPWGEGCCAEPVLVTPLSRAVPVSWWLPGPLGTWKILGMGCPSHQCLHTYRTYISIQSHPLPSAGASGHRVLLGPGLLAETACEEISCEIWLSSYLGWHRHF